MARAKQTRLARWGAATLVALGVSTATAGQNSSERLTCAVESKTVMGRALSREELAKEKTSVRVEQNEAGAGRLLRCGFTPSENRVTCDSYEVDRIEVDAVVKHRKFYVFRNQFDVQVFADLTFIENNGRGGVAFGRCTKGAAARP